ncbi:MAG: DUF5320 domain-containing protein [Anaerolineae bacterium]|jgi:hypothetical protein
MPRGDRTGPWGAGPMTGRGMGYCAGFDAPSDVQGGFGRRMGGRGFWGRGAWGGGYGHRHWFYATELPRWARFGGYWGPEAYPPTPTAAEEAEMLKAHADALRRELAAVEEDLAGLERDKAEEQGEQA